MTTTAATRKANPAKPAKRAPSVPELYVQFERAHAAYQAIPSAIGDKLSNPAFDRAVEKCARVADRIAKAPASTVAEILIKLRVAAWSADNGTGQSLSRLDYWQPRRLNPGAEWATLATVRDDLERMFGALEPDPIGPDGRALPLTGVPEVTAALSCGASPRRLLQAALIAGTDASAGEPPPAKPTAAARAQLAAATFQPVGGRFDWTEESWGRAWLPTLRLAFAMLQRDDKQLQQGFAATIARAGGKPGPVLDTLDGWQRCKAHLESLIEMLDVATLRSCCALERLDFDRASPDGVAPAPKAQ
jgi:hypothetical protein